MKYITHVPLVTFVAFLIKTLLISNTFVDAAILGVLGAVAVCYEIVIKHKDVEQLKAQMNKQREEMLVQSQSMGKDMDVVKNTVASIKMTSGMRPIQKF